MDTLEPITPIASGRYIRLVCRGRWEFVQRLGLTGLVTIVAVTDQGNVLMVEQFRPPVGCRTLELPAGLVGDDPARPGEDLTAGARRELEEETGYSAEVMEAVGEGCVSAGLSSEVVTIFVARGLKKVGPGGGDHCEDIVVHEAPLAAIDAWLKEKAAQGLMIDLKVYTGLHFV
jgi:ADP-ribose pyrophosphatase